MRFRKSYRLVLSCGSLCAALILVGCRPKVTPASNEEPERPKAPVRAIFHEPHVDHSQPGHAPPVVAPKPIPTPPPPVAAPVAPDPSRPVATPQVTTTRGATAVPDPTETLLHNYHQALQRGFIVYNPPAQMTVGTTETIGVRVLRDKLPALPSAGAAPPLPGQTVSSALSVYPRMRVALTSNSGAAFAITPDPAIPATQTVPDTGFAEWRWQVEPLLAGANKTLVVTAWADLSDQHLDPILIQEYLAEVNVEVAPVPPPPTIGQRIQSFVSKNWQWLWAAIVIPAAGWLLQRFSRKKKDDR
jgi:hypothetical protein